VRTDSRTTLNSLNKANKHTYITEEIRHKVHEMENTEWRIGFRRIKLHTVTSGYELADKLATETSGKQNYTLVTIEYLRAP